MADKYGDIYGPGGESPGPIWDDGGPFGGGGGGGGPGGGSTIPNPFIPGFSGGQAPGYAGFGAQAPWGGAGVMQRRRMMPGRTGPFSASQTRMDGSGAQMSAGGGQNLPPGIMSFLHLLTNSQGQNPFMQPQGGSGGGGWHPQSAHDLVGDIVGGGQATMGLNGGAYGLAPPPGILAAIRGQAVQDAGARERSARLGLQAQAGRGDVDPSTYGFQALMSQLGGQDQTARTMSQADLGLRQQQLQFLQNLLGQYLGSNVSLEGQNRQSRAAWEAGGGGSGLGQIANLGGRAAAAYWGGGG